MGGAVERSQTPSTITNYVLLQRDACVFRRCVLATRRPRQYKAGHHKFIWALKPHGHSVLVDIDPTSDGSASAFAETRHRPPAFFPPPQLALTVRTTAG